MQPSPAPFPQCSQLTQGACICWAPEVQELRKDPETTLCAVTVLGPSAGDPDKLTGIYIEMAHDTGPAGVSEQLEGQVRVQEEGLTEQHQSQNLGGTWWTGVNSASRRNSSEMGRRIPGSPDKSRLSVVEK